jgi:GNAT superfamily N-acetyltransferase
MDMSITMNNQPVTSAFDRRAAIELPIVAARLADCNAVVALFGALHAYNASLDHHFALADDWAELLRADFSKTYQVADRLWLIMKDGDRPVGLLIAGIHTDSPLFRHRRWVEVEALYVAPGHRGKGTAHRLLKKAYAWAQAHGLSRVELYVTSTNVRAQAVYVDDGFVTTQAIMRKTLS